jgi:hypothetical protein
MYDTFPVKLPPHCTPSKASLPALFNLPLQTGRQGMAAAILGGEEGGAAEEEAEQEEEERAVAEVRWLGVLILQRPALAPKVRIVCSGYHLSHCHTRGDCCR